jgi:hypothetical protein
MKQIFIFGLLLISFTCFGQSKASKTSKLKTSKFSGFYSYGNDIEKGRIGAIFIYAETDSTILFYIDLNRGAPSYNMGSLYGRVKMKNDSGTFYTKYDYNENGCKWTFNFTKNGLTINTIDNQTDCGFGHAVYADGTFKRQSNKIQEYFEDMEGKKVYFRKTTPEDYYKD